MPVYPEMSDRELIEAAAKILGRESIQEVATEQIFKLITVTQYVTDVCLNELEKRGELAFLPSPEGGLAPIIPYCANLFEHTILTRDQAPVRDS